MQNKHIIVATAEMGYGHLRALYPFANKQEYKFIILGQTDNSQITERKLWRFILKLYETVSKIKDFPFIGWLMYYLMNRLLSIPPKNSNHYIFDKVFAFWMLERLFKIGLCKAIQNEVINGPKILFTSFYAPVIALSKQKNVLIYCQICDSDLSRVWVPRNPVNSNIHYFAPCQSSVDRLLIYGVRPDMIHLTGFPLPDKLVGGLNQDVAKRNFQRRMILFENPKIISSEFPLKVAYVVGGAGAYSDIGIKIALSLSQEIIDGTLVLYLVTGVKKKVILEYRRLKEQLFFNSDNIQIVEASNHFEYFKKFNDVVSSIHLLWTKPSELVFYSALGIPIIMTSPLGPQEDANREWVLENGFGLDQEKLKSTNLWIKEMLEKGVYSKIARQSWDKGIRTALYRVPEIIAETSHDLSDINKEYSLISKNITIA
jgi:hypothetical protein